MVKLLKTVLIGTTLDKHKYKIKIFFRIKKYYLALNCTMRAIKFYPIDSELWLLKGRAEQNIKQFDNALISLKQSIQLNGQVQRIV